jgi:D-alanyl-D-alanine dipeptidase
MVKNEVQTICRNTSNLAPFLVVRLTAALDECHANGYPVQIFEGYRSQERQQWLYEQGRNRPGPIITYAKPGQSFHNVGLAVDVVLKINGKWTWEGQYDKIENIMKGHGFSSLKFEKCHFEINGGLTMKKAWEISCKYGLLHLWSIIESKINDDKKIKN